MSAPDRPTRTKRKPTLLRAVPKRRSLAIARIAPAPAQMPSIAATIGCGQARIALTRSPVMRVKRSRPSVSPLVAHGDERADDLVHVAAGAEVPAGAGEHDRAHVGHRRQRTKRLGELGVGVERQRILALGPVERDRRHARVDVPAEVPRPEVSAGGHHITSPAATAIACPVIAVAPGEQSQTTVAATSSGVINVRRGECFARSARASSADTFLVSHRHWPRPSPTSPCPPCSPGRPR